MKPSKQFQLTVFAVLVGVASAAAVVHVLIQPAERFAKSREGTPFFTPPVIDPDTGEALDLDALISHYKSGG